MPPRIKVRIRRCAACEPTAFLVSRNVGKTRDRQAEDIDQFTEGKTLIHPVWSICSLANDVRGSFD